MAPEHLDPRAQHPVLLPLLGVLIATFLVGLLVHRLEHDPRSGETATVLPYGN